VDPCREASYERDVAAEDILDLAKLGLGELWAKVGQHLFHATMVQRYNALTRPGLLLFPACLNGWVRCEFDRD
jgi:hypothetical protein